MIKLIVLIIATSIILSSCGKKDNSADTSSQTGSIASTDLPASTGDEEINEDIENTEDNPEETTQEQNTVTDINEISRDIVKSVENDLDNDSLNEKIEIIQVTSKTDNSNNEEIEGIIKIKSKDSEIISSFIKKAPGLTGIYRDIAIEDLDGDGNKDIFIVIPETGSPFTLNFYHIYSYSDDRKFSFNVDNKITDFCKGFMFNYTENGMLSVENVEFNFEGVFDLSKIYGISFTNDKIGMQYNRSWVEPVPSEMSFDSRVKLINKKDVNLIMLPLPIFGTATSDIIGEIDLFYKVNENFIPEMDSFEVYELTPDKKVKIGEVKIE